MTVIEKTARTRWYALFVVILCSMFFFIQGCTYAISPEMADKVDKTITFEMLQIDPDLYEGSLVIFGGTIKQTTPLSQGTLIDIIEKPLDYWGKPMASKKTGGRFLVFSPQSIDSNMYTTGKAITVAGEVAGAKLGKIGGTEFTEFTEYEYPVITAREIKLWEGTGSLDQPAWWDPLSDPSVPLQQQY
jgi:outer membrane lipoprotein